MMWKFPWKYRESFIIVLGLFISGLILQLTTHFYIPSVSFPVNLIFAFALLFFCIWLFRNRRNHPLVEWLSSIQAAISAIIFMAVECLCMGLIPQTQDGPPIILLLGLHHLTGSWPFVFAEIYFLLILGLITLTRAFPFKFSNLGFLWFHAGLWITMVAMLLGNGDIQKVMVSLTQH